MENPNPTCNWCLHEWHEEECWCYCAMATNAPEPEFCDNCGDPLTDMFVVFEELPYDVASANAGESGILCMDCHAKLGEANE